MRKKIAVAMSGGVDSSTTAALLKEQGYDVVGLTMELSDCSKGAVEDARQVAAFLGIPHYVVDLREIFQTKVIDYFMAEYLAGRTPNPCVRCNPQVKFGALLQKALSMGCDYLATGHYARVEFNNATGRYNLRKGIDQKKDQAYALYRLKQEQLSHILTPLGDWNKTRTRAEAMKWNLPVAQKPESQEICFIEDDDYKAYLIQHRPEAVSPGNIVDTEGRILGKHQGIAFYTIGQRKGMGLTSPEPLYVVRLDAVKNEVIVGNKQQMFAKGLLVKHLNWVAIPELQQPVSAKVKIRYGCQEASALLQPQKGGKLAVLFEEQQRAVTPGQSAVFYKGDNVLGGGIICRDLPVG